MAVLQNLEPRRVFSYFEQLCAIPHGSGNTGAISDWLAAFGRERGLEVHQDRLGNVIIIKEPSPGYEQAEPVILQGHMDMVCEQAPDCGKDMEREGLDLVVEGDTIYARGTTLGGDDGIAVAMALAVLDDPGLAHPRVEAVFTVEEETGMDGAANLDVSPLKGRRMLNIDSEEEGIFTVSCAGGGAALCVLPLTRAPYTGAALTVTVGGLQGGHSGTEIHKGRGSANMLLGRVLCAASRAAEVRLFTVSGGMKDNAIPREARAVLTTDDPAAVRAVCRELKTALKHEYRVTDPEVFVSVTEAAPDGLPMDGKSTQNAICVLTCLPDGVQAMSPEIPGLVQTSLNLGILRTEETAVKASYYIRSSVDSQRQMLTDRLRCLLIRLGGTVEVSGEYPGWEYRRESPLRELLTAVYTEQYGRAPTVAAIHAGLECGLLAEKLPGLDCVSIGPDLTDIHTCRERMHIASVQRVWAMVVEALRRMK